MRIEDNLLNWLGDRYIAFKELFKSFNREQLPFYNDLEYKLGREEIRNRKTITKFPNRNDYYIRKGSSLENNGKWI